MQFILVIATLIIIPILGLEICNRLGIVESKKWADFYKRKPVANIQWIPLIITLFTCIALFWWASYYNNTSLLLYGGSVLLLALIATIDLYRPIPSWIRLLFQIGIFTTIVIIGWIHIDTIRFGVGELSINTRIGIFWSVIRFIVCTNAINWFDGIQGQASGVSAIWSFSLRAVVAFIVLPSYEHLTPAIIEQLTLTKIIALSLGLTSLVYTIIEYKPLWLVRDIGTTVYWFSLAYLALLGWVKVGTLVVTLSLVLFDWWRVVLHRILIMKKNPMKGDYTHLHHRLIANGRSRSEVRRFVWIRSGAMTVLMLLQWTNSMHKRIIMCMMALLFYGINIYLFRIKKLPNEMKVDFTPQEVEVL